MYANVCLLGLSTTGISKVCQSSDNKVYGSISLSFDVLLHFFFLDYISIRSYGQRRGQMQSRKDNIARRLLFGRIIRSKFCFHGKGIGHMEKTNTKTTETELRR